MARIDDDAVLRQARFRLIIGCVIAVALTASSFMLHGTRPAGWNALSWFMTGVVDAALGFNIMSFFELRRAIALHREAQGQLEAMQARWREEETLMAQQ